MVHKVSSPSNLYRAIVGFKRIVECQFIARKPQLFAAVTRLTQLLCRLDKLFDYLRGFNRPVFDKRELIFLTSLQTTGLLRRFAVSGS